MQNEEVKKSYKKDRLLQDLQIAVWGVLAVLLAVLTLLELFTAGSADIGVGEPIKVSSSLINVGQGRYNSSISGSIANGGKDTVRIEAVHITVSNGKQRHEVELEGFVLPAHNERELYAEWQGTQAFDRVTRVAVVVDGAEDVLPNTADTLPINGIAVLYLVLLLVDALLLVRACKIRYYIYQEMQMQA